MTAHNKGPPPGLEGPVRAKSPWRRRRLRNELQRGVNELASRAERPGATVWRVQPIVEICTPENYPAWRAGRERAWKRDRSRSRTSSWPAQIPPTEIAGVLLPQAHGAHRRGQPAEIALPVFTHNPPPPAARDIEHPHEPLLLGLIVGWVRMTLADPADQHAVLLAPPLVDLITRRPHDRVPHELSISWPLQISKAHVRPMRLS